MDRHSLYQLWQADATSELQNKDRPAFVLKYAEDINEHTDTSEPVPVDGSVPEARAWLDRFKGTVTRQLAQGAAEDTGESDIQADTVGDA